MKIEDFSLVKNICEAAIMAADHPLPKRHIKALFDELEYPGDEMIDEALKAIEDDCAARGYYLKKVSSGYRFQVKQDLSKWVSRLWQEKTPRYSRALLETLALIAYRQPITRGEIEEVRGVAVSSHIIKTLQEREWVKVVGYREVPGRPAMLATTKEFLDYFNLQSISELPPLAEIRDLSEIGKELGFDFDIIEVESKSTDQDHNVQSSEKIEQFDEKAEVDNEQPEDGKEQIDGIATDSIDMSEPESKSDPVGHAKFGEKTMPQELEDSEIMLATSSNVERLDA